MCMATAGGREMCWVWNLIAAIRHAQHNTRESSNSKEISQWMPAKTISILPLAYWLATSLEEWNGSRGRSCLGGPLQLGPQLRTHWVTWQKNVRRPQFVLKSDNKFSSDNKHSVSSYFLYQTSKNHFSEVLRGVLASESTWDKTTAD